MHSILTTALMGFFLLPSVGVQGAVASAESAMEPTVYQTRKVKMTAYNAVPEQTDNDPFTTASGAYSNPEVVIARSVDLKEDLPFGTVVEVVVPESTSHKCGIERVEHFIGYRVVADSMHPRKVNQMDILFDTSSKVEVGGKEINAARALGVCDDVEIRVVGKIDIKEMPKDQIELASKVGLGELASL
jgi:3D (Asp-Asp-Asp) domain-containing protein